MRATWDRWIETQYYTDMLPESQWFKQHEVLAPFAKVDEPSLVED